MIEQLSAGIELMWIGMGIVFLFLVMLIVAVNLMSAIILRFFPEPPALQNGSSGSPAVNEQRIIAAISAAIHQHRAKHR